MNIIGCSLLVIPPLLWSSIFVVGHEVLEKVPPATLTFWTWLIAAFSLLPFTWGSIRHDLHVIRREVVPLFFFALLGVSGFQYLMFAGLIQASTISAAVLSPTIPIIVALLCWPLLKEKLRPLQSLGVIISFMGTCWIATGGSLINILNIESGAGESLILIANLLMAGYTIMLRLYPSQLQPISFMAIIASMGTIQILPFSMMEQGFATSLILVSDSLYGILYIGVVNYSLAYVFWNIAVNQYGATRTAIFLYLIPVFGTILSVIFLRETLYLYHSIGAMLIFAGLYLTLHVKLPPFHKEQCGKFRH